VEHVDSIEKTWENIHLMIPREGGLQIGHDDGMTSVFPLGRAKVFQ